MIPERADPKMLEALQETLKLWESGDYKRADYECPLCEFAGRYSCRHCPCYALLDEACGPLYQDSMRRPAPCKAIGNLKRMIAMVKDRQKNDTPPL